MTARSTAADSTASTPSGASWQWPPRRCHRPRSHGSRPNAPRKGRRPRGGNGCSGVSRRAPRPQRRYRQCAAGAAVAVQRQAVQPHLHLGPGAAQAGGARAPRQDLLHRRAGTAGRLGPPPPQRPGSRAAGSPEDSGTRLKPEPRRLREILRQCPARKAGAGVRADPGARAQGLRSGAPALRSRHRCGWDARGTPRQRGRAARRRVPGCRTRRRARAPAIGKLPPRAEARQELKSRQ